MLLERTNGVLRRAGLAIAAMLAAGLLAACGGSGAGAGGSAGTVDGGQATGMLLFSDKVSLPSTDGSTSATITAQLRDANNNVVPNQRVAFSTTDRGVTLSPVGTTSVTDAAGRVQYRLELAASPDARANRTVTVTATSGTATGSTSVQVIGTRLSIVGPDTLTVGASGEYVVSASDGAGAAVAGLPLTVTFSGGTPASSTLTTGSNGQAKVMLTGVSAGAGSIVASATGVDPATRPVTVVGADTPFRIASPADGAEVTVDTDQTVVIQIRENGVPAAGRSVVVTTTRGTVNGSTVSATVVTNANGEASALVRSSSAGQATVTATAFPGGVPNSVSSRINYVSRTPAKIALSLEPSSIGANAPGSTSSSSRLVATVRDGADNPVKGALVTFSAQDPSNGSIQPSSAVTDASGQAVASFVAGPTSSSAVQISASVFNSAGVLVSGDTKTMTVSAVALFVELGTGNSIEAVDSTTYSMPWSAIVTDANRNPVPGLPVTVSLTAVSYLKGIWVWGGTSWGTVSFDNPTVPPRKCPSEDANRNNLLDAGEDVNGNGRLDPGSPASVRVTSADGKTGVDGRATLSVIYPKSFGEWVEVTMRVTIGSPGTENTISRTFLLPVLASEVTNQTVAPPNVGSRTPTTVFPGNVLTGPYGYVQDCANPN